jgi:hypothetical protein
MINGYDFLSIRASHDLDACRLDPIDRALLVEQSEISRGISMLRYPRARSRKEELRFATFELCEEYSFWKMSFSNVIGHRHVRA